TGEIGVTWFDALEFGPPPISLMPRTTKVTGVPAERPVILQLRPLVSHATVVSPTSVALYDRIGLPPSSAGAVHEIVAARVSGTAVTPVGWPGAVYTGLPMLTRVLTSRWFW